MRCCPTFGTLLPPIALVTLASFAAPAPAAGQSFPPDRPFLEITPQIGFFAPEEPEDSEIEARPLFGARVSHRRAAGFGVEAHGAFTFLELEVTGVPPEVFDLTTLLYGVEGLYAWPISPRASFALGLGLGGVTWIPDRDGSDDLPSDPDSETNLQLTFGAGVDVLLTRSIALRGDLRDHLVFDQLADTARDLELVDRGQTSNLEISVGASFVLP